MASVQVKNEIEAFTGLSPMALRYRDAIVALPGTGAAAGYSDIARHRGEQEHGPGRGVPVEGALGAPPLGR